MNAIWTKTPPEIILIIIEQTNHDPTLTSWSCVSRRFGRVATWQLWRNVKFNITHDCRNVDRVCLKTEILSFRSHPKNLSQPYPYLQNDNDYQIIEPGEIVEHFDFGFSVFRSCSSRRPSKCIRRELELRSKRLFAAAGAAKSVHFYGYLGGSTITKDIRAFRGIKQLKLRASRFCPQDAFPLNMVHWNNKYQEILDFGPLSELKTLRLLSIGEILKKEEAAIAKAIRCLPLIQLELGTQNCYKNIDDPPLSRFFSALESDDDDPGNTPVGFPTTLKRLTLANFHKYLPIGHLGGETQRSFSSCKNLTHLKLNLRDSGVYFEILINLRFPALTHISLDLFTKKAEEHQDPYSQEVNLLCRLCNAYQATLKSVELVNAWNLSSGCFFLSANLRGAENEIHWTAQELRLACDENCDLEYHSRLEDRLLSPCHGKPKGLERWRWGTELSRIRIPRLRSCLPWNPRLDLDKAFMNCKNVRLLVINEILDSTKVMTFKDRSGRDADANLERHTLFTPPVLQYHIHYNYDESTKADMLRELGAEMVGRFESLSALRVLYLDSERFWIERDGLDAICLWRLWDAANDPVQRVHIDREISHADWAFLSDRRADDTVLFLPSSASKEEFHRRDWICRND